MKTRQLITALMSILLTVPAVAAEGNPFGLELGKHPSEYGCSQEQNDKFTYRCKTVPKPHSEFEVYGLQYARGVGICWVKALGKTIENDSYGIATRERVDAIAKQLRQKYGAPTKKHDFILPQSIWDAPDDWMMSIRRNERLYDYSWRSEDGFKPVGEVIQVFVSANAVSGYGGYVAVDFHFKREPQCDAIIEKDGQDSF